MRRSVAPTTTPNDNSPEVTSTEEETVTSSDALSLESPIVMSSATTMLSSANHGSQPEDILSSVKQINEDLKCPELTEQKYEQFSVQEEKLRV